MIDVRDFAQAAPQTSNLSNPSLYVQPVVKNNPVETFIKSRLEIVKASSESLINEHPMIGRLLILGAVSAFENYCRGVLSGALLLCPISQGHASDKNVNLGGAIWHGPSGNFNLSAFEHKSFADAKELRSVFREYIKFEFAEAIFSDLLRHFEVITHLRHAIVHSDGYLPGRNAVKLEIERSGEALLVSINQAKLQECLLILSNLVALINRELFAQMCHRWAVEWRKRSDWKPADEAKTIGAVFDLFVDRPYNKGLPNRRRWGKRALREAVMNEFNLT